MNKPYNMAGLFEYTEFNSGTKFDVKNYEVGKLYVNTDNDKYKDVVFVLIENKERMIWMLPYNFKTLIESVFAREMKRKPKVKELKVEEAQTGTLNEDFVLKLVAMTKGEKYKEICKTCK